MRNNLDNVKFIAHQINTVVGDIDGNKKKIIDLIKTTGDDKYFKIHIFPETAITGYLCGALYDRLDFIKDAEDALDEIQNSISDRTGAVIIGHTSFHGVNNSGFPKLRNSVSLLQYDYERQTYHKQLLANGDHHEDRKYFIAGDETKIFNYYKSDRIIKIGVPICEDAWYVDHTRNIPNEMVKLGAEIIISINQSYFYYGKQLKKYKMFSDIAKHNNVPVIMVNNVGCGDVVKNIVTYQGGSMSFDNNGRLTTLFEQFIEKSDTVNLISGSKNIIVNNKYQEILDCLIYTQKEFFKLQGINKAQVHISGGLDSAIVGYIVKEAMGIENTILISNPSLCNGDETKSNAQYLADKLGIKLYWNPIQEIYNKIKEVDEESFEDANIEMPKTGLSTMQAVLRTVQGLAANHRFGSAIVNTGNHTENVLGWFSFHDVGASGAIQLIGDLTKVELFKLAEHINIINCDNIIPERLYNGGLKPLAELPDIDADPFNYWVMSGICAEIIRNRKNKTDLMFEYDNKMLNLDFFPEQSIVYNEGRGAFETNIDIATRLMKRSVYKCAQASPVAIISPRSRGLSNRETLINKYNK